MILRGRSTTFDESFSYDAVGNRLTHTTGTGAGAETHHYTYDANNRLQARHQNDPGGPLTVDYSYDYEGNRTAMDDATGIDSYQWDHQDRLVSLTRDGITHSYRYDPHGYRIEKATPAGSQTYYLQAEHLEAVYDEADRVIAKYLRGVIVDEIVNGYVRNPSGDLINRTYHHDQHRSVVAQSAHDGTPSATRTYTAFGETQEQTGEPLAIRLGYTGRESDPQTGLYYYRARYYDPAIGRFISEDPIGFEAGVNFYAYVDNNPLIATDPMGLEIVATSHDVFGTDLQHLGYRIYPEDEKFATSQLDRVGGKLVASDQGPYFTVSAGPGGFAGQSLESKVNSQGDAYSPVNTIGVVAHDGRSENQVIEQMINFHETNNQSPQTYDYWPFNSDSGFNDYNSNSYYIGLGNELGLTQPSGISPGNETVTVPGQGSRTAPNLGNSLPAPGGYQGGNSASGGYLLYPSRSNTNIQTAVYAK